MTVSSREAGERTTMSRADGGRAAYERIKDAIMSGEFLPGDPLVELSLAEWCGVSRTPVREALSRLEQDGLAQRGDRGLIVRQSTANEIIDLYEVRVVLEVKAASVAASRRTPADIGAMRRAAEHYRQTPEDDADALVDANREFHRAIWEASHNLAVIDLLDRLNMHLGRHSLTTLQFPGRHETSIAEHDMLVKAIADGDPEAARRAAEQHFTEALAIRLKQLEEG